MRKYASTIIVEGSFPGVSLPMYQATFILQHVQGPQDVRSFYTAQDPQYPNTSTKLENLLAKSSPTLIAFCQMLADFRQNLMSQMFANWIQLAYILNFFHGVSV